DKIAFRAECEGHAIDSVTSFEGGIRRARERASALLEYRASLLGGKSQRPLRGFPSRFQPTTNFLPVQFFRGRTVHDITFPSASRRASCAAAASARRPAPSPSASGTGSSAGLEVHRSRALR